MEKIRWGIIGCGGIAHKFARSLLALNDGELLAGASRTPGRAAEFAAEHGIPKTYTDYEALASDPDMDAVYVATTHNFHHENVMLCLDHGKHVLCEKPLTVNARQAADLIERAQARNLFLMEGMWTRFIPAVARLRGLLADGVIGEVLTLKADFCVKMTDDPEHRLRKKDLAGGALLDLGVYPVAFASMLFGGAPERIQSSAVMGATEVDERSFYLLDYPEGRTAQLSVSFGYTLPSDACVCGAEGYIRVPGFLHPQELEVHLEDREPERIGLPFDSDTGFRFEITHAMECIRAGALESDIMPLAETLQIAQTMDAIRAQWGLRYPGE
jgi:predicted dehydrogenase